jgi:hypothetical protein
VTFQQLYEAVRDQGGFDSGSTGSSLTNIKAWINERYTEIVVKSKWRKAQVEIATTVADQAEYALPATVVDIIEGLLVGDVPYDRVGQATLWRLRSGEDVANRAVWADDYTSTGTAQVELYPAPDDAGDSIQALAVLAPTDLSADADVPIIPADFHGALIDGAIATGYKRLEARLDLAGGLEAEFQGRIEELRRRGNARLQAGPAVIRVV